jgi:hypothetical protein
VLVLSVLPLLALLALLRAERSWLRSDFTSVVPFEA